MCSMSPHPGWHDMFGGQYFETMVFGDWVMRGREEIVVLVNESVV